MFNTGMCNNFIFCLIFNYSVSSDSKGWMYSSIRSDLCFIYIYIYIYIIFFFYFEDLIIILLKSFDLCIIALLLGFGFDSGENYNSLFILIYSASILVASLFIFLQSMI